MQLTPDEAKAIRIRCGKNITEWAALMNVSRQSIHNFEAGRTVVNGTTARLYQLLEAQHAADRSSDREDTG